MYCRAASIPSPSRSNFTSPIQAAVVLVPLEHRAVLHAGVLDRHDLADGPVGEHHAAGVDAEVAREAFSSCSASSTHRSGMSWSSVASDRAPPLDLLATRRPAGRASSPSAFAMSRTAALGR